MSYPVAIRHDMKLYYSNWCFVDAANLLVYVVSEGQMTTIDNDIRAGLLLKFFAAQCWLQFPNPIDGEDD
jgi:hypothetical protein